MSVEIAWKQNILVTDFHLLKSLLVVLGFGSQAFVCGFSRQNINSVMLLIDIDTYQPELSATPISVMFLLMISKIGQSQWGEFLVTIKLRLGIKTINYTR